MCPLTPSLRSLRSRQVPGCTASVYMSASLNPLTNLTSITGTADALLSAGLVSLVSNLLSSSPKSAVLDVDPSELTQRLGLSHILSRGRNDGVASMVRTSQALLEPPAKEEEGGLEEGAASGEDKPQQTEDVALLLSGGVVSAARVPSLSAPSPSC
jgi:sulfur transfer protein SufE